MNLDFKLELNGKTARRLTYINSILPMDLDPRLENFLENDLVQLQDLKTVALDTKLNTNLSPSHLDIIQYVADTDYRAIIGGISIKAISNLVLLSALVSCKNIAILNDQGCVDWMSILDEANIKYATAFDPLNEVVDKVIVINDNATMTDILKNSRDRVLLYIPNNDKERSLWYNHPVTSKKIIDKSIECLAKEFPCVIMGFCLDHDLPVNRIKYWSSEPSVNEMISAINCDNRVERILTSSPANQLTLKQMGFLTTSQEQLCKLININVDMIAEIETRWDGIMADHA